MTSLALTVQPASLPFVRAWVESIRSRSEARMREHVVEAVAAVARMIAACAVSDWTTAAAEKANAEWHRDEIDAHRRVVRQCDITLRGHAYDAARSGR